ncbi:MAG: hypothetical protein RL352_1256 [Actinomycetota bacterium]
MNHNRTNSKALLAILGIGITVILGACSSDSESQASASSTTSTTSDSGTSIDTTKAIKAAAWNPTIKIAYSDGSINFQPDGIPNHERDEYYAVPDDGVVVPDANSAHVMKDPTKAQSYSFDIPSIPEYSSTVTKANLGSIGVMISGAVLYNPYEGDGSTVAMASNFTITDSNGITASFVDKCAGHPTPDMGAYHYHGLPNCVTKKVDKEEGASHIIGVALDGFPIYGANDINGKPVDVKKLDECNGISSPTPEFPSGIYHYVLPGTNDATSSIRCFHGKVDTSQIQQMPNMGPMPDLNAAAKKLGITVTQLTDAFNNTLPPDFPTAAKNLGITETELKAALGVQ